MCFHYNFSSLSKRNLLLHLLFSKIKNNKIYTFFYELNCDLAPTCNKHLLITAVCQALAPERQKQYDKDRWLRKLTKERGGGGGSIKPLCTEYWGKCYANLSKGQTSKLDFSLGVRNIGFCPEISFHIFLA